MHMKIEVKNHTNTEARVAAVDLRSKKQVSLQSLPEYHNRGAIAYDSRQGVPKSRSISMKKKCHHTISPGGKWNVDKKLVVVLFFCIVLFLILFYFC